MKTVNVMVMVQMEIKGDDPINEVKDQLEVMDNIIRISELESQPQMFISNIDESDILDPLNEDEDY